MSKSGCPQAARRILSAERVAKLAPDLLDAPRPSCAQQKLEDRLSVSSSSFALGLCSRVIRRLPVPKQSRCAGSDTEVQGRRIVQVGVLVVGLVPLVQAPLTEGPQKGPQSLSYGPCAVPSPTNTHEHERAAPREAQRFRGFSPLFAAVRRSLTNRGAEIRTRDLTDPNGARYQAAPRPDARSVFHTAMFARCLPP
jgi:hypothetical protein